MRWSATIRARLRLSTQAGATMTRRCDQCGHEFAASRQGKSRGYGGWSRFCGQTCFRAWRKAQPRRATPHSIRRLRDDEPVPEGQPRRYIDAHGYVILRWKVGVRTYLEALEHRVVAGRQMPHVHHVNGDQTDNRPENLRPMTASEHLMEHATIDYVEAARLYQSGRSLPDLGRHFGIDHVAIMRGLKKRGIKMRTIREAWQPRRAK